MNGQQPELHTEEDSHCVIVQRPSAPYLIKEEKKKRPKSNPIAPSLY